MSQEDYKNKTKNKSDWLRAAVLGSNDGIISVASIIAGVAGASNSSKAILTAGIASLFAGAFSMAAGEYVSVSSQRDNEKVLLEKEKLELIDNPDGELKELIGLYKMKGLSDSTAEIVAKELTSHDVFNSHADVELGIDPNNLTNPWSAAYASAIAFCSGGIIPLIMIIISPKSIRIPVMFFAVLLALIITGTISAKIGGANKTKAITRIVLGGIIAMIVTFGVGKLFGMAGI